LNYKEKRAIVTVPEDQQSLAIGKEGQNARLANKLTKWKIDIKGVSGVFSSEDAEGGVVKQASDEKVVGVWDAEIRKFNELEEKKEKDKKSEKEEILENNENNESESTEEDSENKKEEITSGEKDLPAQDE
jgi:N utilization substance protein A